VREGRVGYYKLSRHKKGKEFWIEISHFWKSDLGTQSETEPAQRWILATDRAGAPIWFGEVGARHIGTLRLTRALVVQLSRDMCEERWGPSPGKLHKSRVRTEHRGRHKELTNAARFADSLLQK
jgi:hypothetical protein